MSAFQGLSYTVSAVDSTALTLINLVAIGGREVKDPELLETGVQYVLWRIVSSVSLNLSK